MLAYKAHLDSTRLVRRPDLKACYFKNCINKPSMAFQLDQTVSAASN
jgi:hypothetical protein